jgi:serine/threonine protein kinase
LKYLCQEFIQKILAQLVSAFLCYHEKGIIHRDIKLDNILITQTNEIKLTDFGLSNLLSQNQNLRTFPGTIGYISYEISKSEAYPFPANIWSLGCVRFKLITFEHPFGDAIHEIFINVENG